MTAGPRPLTAVILAAGLGSRLGRLSGGGPKGLAPIGGEPLIGRSLRLIRAAGIDDVVLVTGFRAEAYREFIAGCGFPIRTVHNPDFARTGSMHSLFLARGAIASDCLLVESDLLYEPRAVERLAREPGGDHVLVSGPTGQGDEVYAYGEGSRLRQLSKAKRAADGLRGEFVGLSRLSGALLDALCLRYRARADFPAPCAYEDLLSELAPSHPIRLLVVPDLVWAEIDDPAQYERAASRVWPALAARSSIHVGSA